MNGTHESDASIAKTELVIVRFQWTLKEFRKAYWLHFSSANTRSARYVLHILSGTCLICGSVVLMMYSLSKLTTVLLLAAMLLCSLWFSLPLWIILASKSHFARRSDKDTAVEWHIGSEELRCESQNGSSRLKWTAMVKVVHSQDGLMLYQLENFFHWLPRHAFASDADFERVVGWAEQKIPVHRSS